MKRKHDWNALKAEFVTGDMTVSELSKKHGISYGTLYRHYQIEHWNKLREEYFDSVLEKCADNASYISAIALSKELDIAGKLSDVLLRASEDERQFNRYIVKGKEYTEELIFDKVDMDALNNAIKALKSLQEIKKVMNEAASPKEHKDEDTKETGIVILPNIKEENDEI